MAFSSYDDIAEWYDRLVRTNPLYRELVLPSMMRVAGDVRGLTVCDVACGQGLVAREMSRLGAMVTGVDTSAALLHLARQYEEREPLQIRYVEDDAQSLTKLADASFDGVTCGMALMNIPDLEACAHSIKRILKVSGWFVTTITHPCFQTSQAEWVVRADGRAAREVSAYFDERYWESDNPDGVRGRVGEHHRMLSTYLNTFAGAGFLLERLDEPVATGARARQVAGNLEVPSILTMRFRTG